MNKKTLILAGVLGVLLIIAFAYKPLTNFREEMGRPNNFLEGVKYEEITRVEINNAGNIISLERDGERWKNSDTKDFWVTDNDAAGLKKAIEDLAKAEVEIVSKNAEKKGDYETDSSGRIVKLFQKESVIAEFVAGKNGSDFSSTYISMNNEDPSTYKFLVNVGFVFSKPDWYDRKIFETEKDKISKIRFQYPTSEFTVEKNEEGEWAGTIPYAFGVDEEKISEVLDIMSNLHAADIPAQTFDGTGLEKNSIIVQASGDEVDQILMVGDVNPENEEQFFAKKGSSDNIYLIDKSQKETLDTTIRGLR